MIGIKSIKKSYGEFCVMQNFSYEFSDKGLYVLFGPSGCGKSTLLNILAGILPFEEGEIKIGGESYRQRIESESYEEEIAYITQDAFFVEYLTVLENMQLCSAGMERIKELSEKFELTELWKKEPATLSGGERQRVALVQAMLKNKRILLLDEPTSALDRDNKEKVFRMLEQLKEEKLIICACHDKDILPYSDGVINFTKQEEEKKQKSNPPQKQIEQNASLQKQISKKKQMQKGLFQNICKQYRKNSKAEGLILFCLFTVVILTLAYCYDFDGKLEYSLANRYHQNGLTVMIPVKDHTAEYLEELKEKYHIVEYVFDYGGNAPLAEGDPNSTVDPNDFDQYMGELPFSKDAFYYADHIKYGSYFTDAQQVILGYDEAVEMNAVPEKLIHTTYKTKLYDKEYEFEIVGIFDKMDDAMVHYLKTIDESAGEDMGIYTNGKFTERYAFDNIEGNMEKDWGKAQYNFYFASIKDMNRFKKDFPEKLENPDAVSVEEVKYFAEYRIGTASYSHYLYPACYAIVLLGILLYYMLKKMQLVYGQKNLCVYQYYGYSYSHIRWCTVLYYILELSVLYALSALFSTAAGFVTNLVNEKYGFTEFLLFKTDVKRMAMVYGILLGVSLFASLITFWGLKAKGWYQLLMERRDLL